MIQTSLMAYVEMLHNGTVGRRQALVYKYINRHPNMTAYEISQGLGFSDPNTVRPRINELIKKQYILVSGQRPCSITGKLANTYINADKEDKCIL